MSFTSPSTTFQPRPCFAELPAAIDAAIADVQGTVLPNDTAYDELVGISNERETDLADALYLLGFSTYQGFSDVENHAAP